MSTSLVAQIRHTLKSSEIGCTERQRVENRNRNSNEMRTKREGDRHLLPL